MRDINKYYYEFLCYLAKFKKKIKNGLKKRKKKFFLKKKLFK